MTLYSDGRGRLSPSAAREMAPRLYAAAGIGPEEIDIAELYDAFTPLVPLQLEDYGLCKPVDVAEFMLAGATVVQVGTASFVRDPAEILAEFSAYLREAGMGAADLTGALR